MSRNPSTFRQRDVTAAIKGVEAAGLPVGRVEIDRAGKIIIITKLPVNPGTDNDLDLWIAKHADAA